MTPVPRPSPVVRTATTADVPALAMALARAFDDDPVWQWIFPDPGPRGRGLIAMFGVLLRHVHLRHGATETAGRGDLVEAGALWDPPGHWRVPLTTQLRQGVPLVRAFGTRLLPALRALSAVEKQHPEEPHWYLAVLGTDPAAQGNGLGGALLRSRLDRCDADGLPAYLESSKESNVPYYERFGFEVTQEVKLARGAPTVWLMWRNPPAP